MKKHIYILDVCGTLFRENTTYGFMQFYFQKQNKRKYWLLRTIMWKSMKGFLWLNEKAWGSQRVRYSLIGLLNNEPKEQILREAKRYVNHLMEEKKNEEVWDKIDSLPEEQLYLISASLSPVIEELSNRLNCAWQSSVLEFRDDICTGKLSVDLQGDKWAHLPNSMKDKTFTVFTDNRDDLELVLQAQGRYIISKDRHRAYWKENLEAGSFTFINY